MKNNLFSIDYFLIYKNNIGEKIEKNIEQLISYNDLLELSINNTILYKYLIDSGRIQNIIIPINEAIINSNNNILHIKKIRFINKFD